MKYRYFGDKVYIYDDSQKERAERAKSALWKVSLLAIWLAVVGLIMVGAFL